MCVSEYCHTVKALVAFKNCCEPTHLYGLHPFISDFHASDGALDVLYTKRGSLLLEGKQQSPWVKPAFILNTCGINPDQQLYAVQQYLMAAAIKISL